mmetsp:Transcript_50020/g.88112  ORF Transcript_50020/g.88112 Transcript_50020/m.88112 type:complete len:242 (+) Transcript_50020:2487-3212(+)
MSNCFGTSMSTASGARATASGAFEEQAPWRPLLPMFSNAATSSLAAAGASSIRMGGVAGFTLCTGFLDSGDEIGGCQDAVDFGNTASCEVRGGCQLGAAACKLGMPRIPVGYLAAPLLATHQLLAIAMGLVDRCRRPRLEALRVCHWVPGLTVRARAFATTRVGVRFPSTVPNPDFGVSGGSQDRLWDAGRNCGPGLSDLASAGGLMRAVTRGACATRGLLKPPTNLKVKSRDVTTGDCSG